MTNGRVEVITSVQRRRRWPHAEKERIVAASLEAGAIASEVARAAGIHTSQLYRWRRDLCGRADGAPTFAAVTIAPAVGGGGERCGMMEIEFASGARLRITGAVEPAAVSAVVTALAGARR
jgi:transposase